MAKQTKKDLEANVIALRRELTKAWDERERAESEVRCLKQQRTSMHETVTHAAGVNVGWREAHRQLAAVLAEVKPERRDTVNVPMRGRDGHPEEGTPHE